ncbi:PKD domain-containing protein [Pelobium manganitolerans]|uniref:PKD domain-containing protein n=1 Tax=Pelobium manganitolerans TaxID=1842495 RepID=UPI003FA36CBE
MRKTQSILLFIFLLFLNLHTVLGQSVKIGDIADGAFGQGSTIAVPISIEDADGKLPVNNVFKLLLSDADGSFTSPKEIGEYKGFYSTFVNGTIPANLAPGQYRVKVSCGAGLSSEASDPFTIAAKKGLTAAIDANANQTISNQPKTFGLCQPERSSVFRFSNSSTGASTKLTVVDNRDGSSEELDFTDKPILSVNATMRDYTLWVWTEKDGVIATQAFFLINNIIKPGFSAPANSTVCLPADLQYDIETESSNGIQNNFPGYSYQINWGDGVIEEVTPNQIMAAKSQISHRYVQSSCGKQIRINDVNYYNVYGIIYQVKSPFCGLVSVPISTQSKVVTQPENRFKLPESLCINTAITIPNGSLPGDNPSATSPECGNSKNLYYWYVDDVAITPQGVPISYNLQHVFDTPGFHTIRLESQSFAVCDAAPISRTVYVQEATKPDFGLSETKACVGAEIYATDASVYDLDPNARNSYHWQVEGNAYEFIQGTDASSKNPVFRFKQAGVYKVKLQVLSPCNAAAVEKTVVINETPTIKANWAENLCGKNQLLSFDDRTGNAMQTLFTGTSLAESDTYQWEISGGRFSFKNGSNENSKYPSILFEDFGTYQIVVRQVNNCGSTSLNKSITFSEAPTVNAGANQEICASGDVALDGKVEGIYENLAWTGGTGTFRPSRNVANPIYTPSETERQQGKLQLLLSVKTQNSAPCDVVEDAVEITINPAIQITSAKQISLCSGSNLDYQPTSNVAQATYEWFLTKAENVNGAVVKGSGAIKSKLACADVTADGYAIYQIVAKKGNCLSDTATLKVEVKTKPAFSAMPSSETICSGKTVAILLNSAFADLKYTWTSVASAKISGNSQNNTSKALKEITETLLNDGDSTGTVTYTIVPQNSTGCAGDPVTLTLYVSASGGVTTFSPDRTAGCSPLKITFKNNTKGSANKYVWDFGDGITYQSNSNQPVQHTYNSPVTKVFTAKLTTETDCGVYTSQYVIRVSPNTVEPELVVNGDQYEGCAPHTVQFFNNSKGATFYKYDFGDGTIIEGNQSPETITHTFSQGGTYVVKLTASNGCSDTTTTETIRVFPNAKSAFFVRSSGTCDSVNVQFENQSTGAISYLWDFGDGETSTAKNPVHLYRGSKSSYSVKLISYSAFACADTLEKIDLIHVGNTPQPKFGVSPGLTIQYPNYRFIFKNETAGDIKSYLWEFGDGQSATGMDAEHSYADTGSYKVKLTAVNANGCSNSVEQTVKILGVPGSLFIPNAFMPNSLVDEIRVFKPKGSGMAEWHFRIFNKWGQLIWETTALDDKGRPVEGWDGLMYGDKAPQGIYFWEASAKFINGTEWAGMSYREGAEPKKAGTLNLIR